MLTIIQTLKTRKKARRTIIIEKAKTILWNMQDQLFNLQKVHEVMKACTKLYIPFNLAKKNRDEKKGASYDFCLH